MTFAHIGIKVTNLDESLKFYTELLGCTVMKDETHPGSRLVFLSAHGTTIELIYKEENTERTMGPIEHLAFKVESLAEHIALIERQGYTVTEPRVVGENRICFFDGPDNERIELMERAK